MEFCFIYVITNKLDGKKYCGYQNHKTIQCTVKNILKKLSVK